jgi:hypothetical protein
MPVEKYEGPFESQEQEDAAYKRWATLRARERAEAEVAEKDSADKKKKGKLLPVVE